MVPAKHALKAIRTAEEDVKTSTPIQHLAVDVASHANSEKDAFKGSVSRDFSCLLPVQSSKQTLEAPQNTTQPALTMPPWANFLAPTKPG